MVDENDDMVNVSTYLLFSCVYVLSLPLALLI